MFEAYLDFIDWLESRCIFDGAARTLGLTLSANISRDQSTSSVSVPECKLRDVKAPHVCHRQFLQVYISTRSAWGHGPLTITKAPRRI